MDAKEYLNQYETSQRKLKTLQQEIKYESEKLKGFSSELHSDDKSISLIKSHIYKLKCLEEEHEIICNDVLSKVRLVPDTKGVILYKRYIELTKWEDIAEQLSYSEKNVYHIHSQALDYLQNMLDKEAPDQI